jgi:hypothetical protein
LVTLAYTNGLDPVETSASTFVIFMEKPAWVFAWTT